ncbi:RimJ/RimL family protein N-acetyltransferase [Yoonia maricola]|uniref:RimJ/RimL family protein N-acetyltransferase n=1 Tax=Yoonia maricola TaxID=420999 RepID=A0A2M8W302_9RHOB|nr:GNAT family protein [Yoonia maricola]PJI85288.1 RimJ/RimL family protein N-acetyltransferase [Yoonia maricola]
MTDHFNAHGQPIGAPVSDWTGCDPIPRTPMHGSSCDVVPLERQHSAALHTAFSQDESGALWTYMPTGPFQSESDYAAWVAQAADSQDPLFFAIIGKSNGQAVGVASFLRIQPENGVAEVGYITFAPALQRTVMATEAMYLMMKRVMGELGYRRYEWKCDALNAPSRAAAARLGFQYDGLFKQARVYKGRNRDTAWFSILDRDWPALQRGYEAWLNPANFDAHGRQRASLQACIARPD